MSQMLEIELRRERWRRRLAAEALDRTDRDDFTLGGLGSRVEEPTTRLLLLPSDGAGANIAKTVRDQGV